MKRLFTLILLMFLLAQAGYGHVADEISVRTDIVVNSESIGLKFNISSGVLFSTAFLKTLDPDRNKIFEDADLRAFSDLFLDKVKLNLNGEAVEPEFTGASTSEWGYFAAGISTIILEYSLPHHMEPDSEVVFDYELSFYPDVTVYSLSIHNETPDTVGIIEENRNEFGQDMAQIRLSNNYEQIQVVKAAVVAAKEARKSAIAAYKEANFTNDSFERFGINDFIRGTGNMNIAVLMALAALVGFLHAFTPGHGKALVSAFLIANHGKPRHALFVGIVITVTHTASIYAFGALANASRFFLPGEFIPLISIGCGLFIVYIGLWGFVKRLMGRQNDHAHILPNLQILGKNTVNILIDGKAAAANEALMIAMDDEELCYALESAGAGDINLCTPGCSTHGSLPAKLRERQNAGFYKAAVKTGAVDVVVMANAGAIKHLRKLKDETQFMQADTAIENPKAAIIQAIDNYKNRGEVKIPEQKLSTGRLVSLGVAGGLVPCPDALAVLLAAVAAGQVLLGMEVIFFFSIGLAIALVALGMAVVAGKRVLGKQRRIAAFTNYLPYAGSVFIAFLGILMIKSSIL